MRNISSITGDSLRATASKRKASKTRAEKQLLKAIAQAENRIVCLAIAGLAPEASARIDALALTLDRLPDAIRLYQDSAFATFEEVELSPPPESPRPQAPVSPTSPPSSGDWSSDVEEDAFGDYDDDEPEA